MSWKNSSCDLYVFVCSVPFPYRPGKRKKRECGGVGVRSCPVVPNDEGDDDDDDDAERIPLSSSLAVVDVLFFFFFSDSGVLMLSL